ncbi:hypothetical protein OESDEN_12917 [Oesophagostomum dentatum]|uniref:C2 DOCK-type domain-containing protein n=1 Tax=Oesophagostomum dentatum TaxID=61180 RepID=A0A0B1STU2_OESDE|nr:hypothetical protein OESDEN_12917 [Oesophagostomum dentatum]
MQSSSFQPFLSPERFVYGYKALKQRLNYSWPFPLSLKAPFKLEKVLQACEIADASEPYASGAAKDDRTREKLSAAAADYCERLGGTGEELLMRLSPEMLRVAPFSGTELTKDIQEFPARGLYMANTSYRNLLYIYPKSANLSNRPGTARNISIKVELMNGQEQPLPLMFARGAGCDMVSSIRTSVVYHNKTPHIADEIKLRIPVDLDDGHHLLFSFYHISCKASKALSAACFETMGQLVKICTMLLDSCLDIHGRSALLTSYIHYFKIAMKEDMEKASSHHQRVPCEAVPSTSNKAVHEELAELWVRSGGCAREMAFLNAWFFLELMIKSMAEYLSMTGRLYLTRRSRFSERDAFSLMDRSYVMGLVRDFNRDISSKISCVSEPAATTLMLLKLDFIRIVSSHEHFVILNLPSTTTTIDSWGSLGSGELTYDFRRCHYLVGLALADLASVLDSSSSHVLHSRAISVIHNLLSAHEADSRLTDPGIRSRVASLYLPLVTIVLDVADQIHDPFVKSTAITNGFPSDDPLSSSTSPGVNPKVALAIAGIGSAISPPRTPTGARKSKTPDPSKATLSLELSRQMHMFACNQSVQALECIFVSQRTLVKKFSDVIFEQEAEQCGELCLQLLRHCASRLPAVRSQAAASLYLLMRESYENGSSLARVKMQITMSLSTLVSNATREGVWLNEDCLRRSLKVRNFLVFPALHWSALCQFFDFFKA